MLKKVRVGLLGLGTVGGGTALVLSKNAAEISRRCGASIDVAHAAARDLPEGFHPPGTENAQITDDAFAVVKDPNIDIVVELIGGYEPARQLVLEAISNGKHVVTANKALIAMHGSEILAAADKAGVMVAYEAAVAGGIPIIKAMREGLAANQIEWLAGIINGTGNFILTEMRDKGRDFADVLIEAQELGYAEADPTFDVEGIDAAHKLCILSALAFGTELNFEAVYTEGISKITPEDVEYAAELGYRIKHLGITRKTESGIEMRVHPTLIPQRRLIANVDGVMNAVLVKANAVGPTLYYGAGAGAEPTASAVVADIIDVVRTMDCDAAARLPLLGFKQTAATPWLPIDQCTSAYYLRLLAEDRPGVLADISRILGEAGISIEAMIQKEPADPASGANIIMLTQAVQEGKINGALELIEMLSSVSGSVTKIRVEALSG